MLILILALLSKESGFLKVLQITFLQRKVKEIKYWYVQRLLVCNLHIMPNLKNIISLNSHNQLLRQLLYLFYRKIMEFP